MNTHITRVDPKIEREWGTELSLKEQGYILKLLVIRAGAVFSEKVTPETHYIRDGKIVAVSSNEIIEYGDIYRPGETSYIAIKETTLIEIR